MGHFFFGPSKRGGLSNFPLHIRSGLSSFLMLGGGGNYLPSNLYFGVSQFVLFQREEVRSCPQIKGP